MHSPQPSPVATFGCAATIGSLLGVAGSMVLMPHRPLDAFEAAIFFGIVMGVVALAFGKRFFDVLARRPGLG